MISSSVSDDFPAPPVPVMPITGGLCCSARGLITDINSSSLCLFDDLFTDSVLPAVSPSLSAFVPAFAS